LKWLNLSGNNKLTDIPSGLLTRKGLRLHL